MQQEISSADFAELLAYYRIDPWGEQRDDLRTALLCSVIANALASGKGRRFKLADFLLDFEAELKKPQTAKQMEAIFRAFTVARGGTIE